MKLTILSSIIFVCIIYSCQTPSVRRAGGDPDIVLVNIEKGDRVFISKLLSKIDSIKPKVIGIVIYFQCVGHTKSDSLLSNALKNLKGDILSYGLDDDGKEEHSISLFTKAVDDEGVLKFEKSVGLVSRMTPKMKIKGRIHESLALKIAKRWDSTRQYSFDIDRSMTIDYSRTLDDYLRLEGSALIDLPLSEFDLESLQKKIFLVGFIGPGEENMYRTPLRFLANDTLDHHQPDTYGLVILANQIRTILDKGK